MLIEWSDPYQEVHESYALLNINNGKIISKFNTLEDANFYVHNSKNNFINLGNNVKIKIKTKAKL
ncbi:MAG: hypothetical protein M0R17_06220 [Candidatus Omnitrophica bacterium]|jgi:hypothetical protein|nr:hypothetical protein [Candidatus Omnitrophota bacterium]